MAWDDGDNLPVCRRYAPRGRVVKWTGRHCPGCGHRSGVETAAMVDVGGCAAARYECRYPGCGTSYQVLKRDDNLPVAGPVRDRAGLVVKS